MEWSEKKDLVLIYYDKGDSRFRIMDHNINNLINSFQKKVVITRTFPASRIDLGNLLRSSKLLISLDTISNITYEATLCGTPALIVNDIFGFSKQKFNVELAGIFSDVKDYEQAVKDVGKSFENYLNMLKNNKTTVKEFVDNCITHFSVSCTSL